MTTPLSIVNILLWLAEMGLAGADGGGCTGVVAGPCASTATGKADKVASNKESLLVTSKRSFEMALTSFREKLKAALGASPIRRYVFPAQRFSKTSGGMMEPGGQEVLLATVSGVEWNPVRRKFTFSRKWISVHDRMSWTSHELCGGWSPNRRRSGAQDRLEAVLSTECGRSP